MKLVLKSIVFCIVFMSVLLSLPAYAEEKMSASPKDWMSKLDESTPLSKINIPGTHDSGSYTLTDPVKSVWAKTQELDYKGQLEKGIRFFDIRGRATSDNSIGVHHGVVYLHHNFGDFVKIAKQFLTENSGETIILSMKKDHDPAEGVTKNFPEIFKDSYFDYDEYKDYFYHEMEMDPKLKDVKGKIVLFNRMGQTSINSGYGMEKGIHWPDNQSFETKINNDMLTLHVQDEYKDSYYPKVDAIKKLLEKSKNETTDNNLYVNFLSVSSGGTAFNSAYYYASYINPEIAKYINENKNMRTGWLIMDYAGYEWSGYPDIIKAVIDSNKEKGN